MRIYEHNNKKYLSVTSILDLIEPFDKKSFEVWCDKHGHNSSLLGANSSLMGEKVSRYIRDISEGLNELTEPCTDLLDEKLRAGADKFLQDFTIKSCEQAVYCDELNYAGRYDALTEDTLIDFKTYGAWKNKPYKRDSKKIKSCRKQLSLYAYAMDWRDKLAVVVFKNDGDYELEYLDFDPEIVAWVKDNQDKILNLLAETK